MNVPLPCHCPDPFLPPQLFLELEVPLAMGETNPLFNLILDLFLINPMPVRLIFNLSIFKFKYYIFRGMKFDQAIFTR